MGAGRLSKAHSQIFSRLLDKVCDALAREPGVIEIRVFGSYAQGKLTQESDLDIAVVVTPESFSDRNRLRSLVSDVRDARDPGLDLVFVPADEYASRRDLGGICFEIAHSGSTVWRRPNEPF